MPLFSYSRITSPVPESPFQPMPWTHCPPPSPGPDHLCPDVSSIFLLLLAVALPKKQNRELHLQQLILPYLVLYY
ncbi:hypothetical protein BDW66DRAFT_129633 [Aspergillus desertorum]